MNKWAYILVLALFISCSEGKKEEIPTGVLDRTKCISVFIDLHEVDGYAAFELGQDFENKERFYPFYKNIFSRHNITQQDFEKSMNYYGSEPDRMQKIYLEVIDSLKMRKANLR